MTNVFDQSTWWNLLLTSAIFTWPNDYLNNLMNFSPKSYLKVPLHSEIFLSERLKFLFHDI